MITKKYFSFCTNTAGLTLIELMVSVGIMSMLVILMLTVIVTASVSLERFEGRVSTQQEARQLLGIMIRELAETSPGRVDLSVPNQITFTIPIRVISGGPMQGRLVDDGGDYIYGARPTPTIDPDGYQYARVQYRLEPLPNSNFLVLVRRVVDGSGNELAGTNAIIIAKNVNSLTFGIDKKTLFINYTIQRPIAQGNVMVYGGTWGVTLRN